jgi:hypothetical protein
MSKPSILARAITARLRRRPKISLVVIPALVGVGAFVAIALSAELNVAELDTDTTANAVTVEQGKSANFTFTLSASGAIQCGATETANVHTSYSVDSSGNVSSSTFSGTPVQFPGNVAPPPGSPSGNCTSTGGGSISASVSAATTAPLGDHTINIQKSAGNVAITNSNTTGAKLDDTTGYTLTIHVVAPAAPPNSAPALAVTGGDATDHSVTVDEGQTANNSGTWSDSNSGDTVALSASVGTITQSGNNSAGTWSWSYDTTDGPDNSQTVTITADDGHTQTLRTFALTVNNVAPQVSFTSAPSSADEGQTKTYNYSVNDPGADTYSVDGGYPSCGTGQELVSGSPSLSGSSGSQTGTFQCKFPDGPASPTVGISLTDSDGASGSASQAVTVSNVAPTISSPLSLSGATGTACVGGTSVGLAFSVSDPAGANDTVSGSIDWGDTQTAAFGPSPGSVTGTSVSTSHPYSAGNYTIRVNAGDEDGGNATQRTGAVSLEYATGAILPPFNPDGSSIFKYGSTIPVKVQVTDCNATPVGGLSPSVVVRLIDSSTPPNEINETSVSSTSAADTGTQMRWDPTSQQYIYNLASKSLSDGTARYRIYVGSSTSDLVSQVSQTFGLRLK